MVADPANRTTFAASSALNLLAHPLAGMAAASALGMGMMAHAAGLWFGAMAGAAEAVQRLERQAGTDQAETTRTEAGKTEAAHARRPADAAAVEGARARVVELAKARSAREASRSAGKAPATRVAPAGRAARAERGGVAAARQATTPSAPIAGGHPADDLKAIAGIGPKLEQALNAMGFRTYAQIAALSDADIERIETKMGFAGRVARDGWLGQASALAGKIAG